MRQTRTFSGDRLRDLRLKRRLTLKKVAAAVGVSYSLVSLWETGKSKPVIGDEMWLEQVFGVSRYYFRIAAVDAAGAGSGLRKGA